MLAALPHKKVLVQLEDNEKICPNCGHELSSLGEEYIRSEVVPIPARIEVIDYYRQSFECRHCRKEGRSTIIKPVMPQPVIPHSIASASVVAHSMIQKYQYALPLYRQEQGTLVKEGIDRISQLFHLESDYTACFAAERKQKRLDEEKPCLEALLAWAETNKEKVLPKSPLSKALYYLLSNWDGLTRYLEDGRCSLSNNIAENSIRPFTVGRKNWLFSGSPKGARASAAVYSIIETCKANQINPENYLLHLLQHLRMKRNFQIETY